MLKHNPTIGIFWIIDDELLAKKVKLSEVEEVNGVKDSGLSHFFEWKKMGFDIDEYDKFPRGRIVYDIDNGFVIYVSKGIRREHFDLILSNFQICKNYRFICDESYLLKKDEKVLNYDIPTIYKFNNLIFKLPKNTQELYEYSVYLHCVTGGDFGELIKKHNNKHLIFGVYFDENNRLGKLFKHKNNLGYVLLISLKDDNIAFDMAVDGERYSNDIDYTCVIESYYDDELEEKEKIFKEFAKYFKSLDNLVDDAIMLMKAKKCKTPITHLQRKLQVGYNRAAKIKEQICMFGLLGEKGVENGKFK